MKISFLTIFVCSSMLIGCNEYFSISPSAISTNTLSPPTLALDFPTTATSLINTPTLTVSGVIAGETVRLYSDSSCTSLVATGVAAASTIDLTSSSLGSGTYNFTAIRTSASATSSCSPVAVNYIHTACPVGYIPVTPRADAGTISEFCVMKYEARDVGTVPTSDTSGTPWVNMTAGVAKTLCTGIAANYDLISNPEWMTIAYHLEEEPANWTSGIVGTEQLYQGHSDNGPAIVLGITSDSDPYTDTLDLPGEAIGSGREQKRTMEFSYGETIWDFSGNVAEWIDWTPGGVWDAAPTTCFPGAWLAVELYNIACGDLDAEEYMPLNPAGIGANYGSTFGMGVYQYLGVTGGAASRGGSLSFPSSGIYHITDNRPIEFWGGTGFRCVYRP